MVDLGPIQAADFARTYTWPAQDERFPGTAGRGISAPPLAQHGAGQLVGFGRILQQRAPLRGNTQHVMGIAAHQDKDRCDPPREEGAALFDKRRARFL